MVGSVSRAVGKFVVNRGFALNFKLGAVVKLNRNAVVGDVRRSDSVDAERCKIDNIAVVSVLNDVVAVVRREVESILTAAADKRVVRRRILAAPNAVRAGAANDEVVEVVARQNVRAVRVLGVDDGDSPVISSVDVVILREPDNRVTHIRADIERRILRAANVAVREAVVSDDFVDFGNNAVNEEVLARRLLDCQIIVRAVVELNENVGAAD